MARKFRVKANNNYPFDVVGDVLTAESFVGDKGVLCKNPRSPDKDFHWCYIIGQHVEEIPVFAVGDAVRVKAGSPRWENVGGSASGIAPGESWFGRRLIVQADCQCYGGYRLLQIETLGVTDNYLEPWNDAEEWDGSKWVAKKPKPKLKKGDRVKIVGLSIAGIGEELKGKTATVIKAFGPDAWDINVDGTNRTFPLSSLMLVCEWTVKPADSSPKPAIVCLREDGQLKPTTLAFVCDSTNEAFRLAEVRAKAYPGKEFVVLQEKGSKRMEPKSKADRLEEYMLSDMDTMDHEFGEDRTLTAAVHSVSRCGNLITVTYDASGD